MGILRKKGGGDVYAKRLSSRGKTTPSEDSLYRVGTLRSELDEPADMPQAFEDLVMQAARAKLAFDNGDMNKSQYAMVLRGLRLVAPDGTEWTTGAASGTWYCRPIGGAWVRATPPSEEKPGTAVVARTVVKREVAIPVTSAGIKSGESYQVSASERGVAEVTQSASSVSPVNWESPERLDEHGVWNTEWVAPERSKPASDEDLLDEILKAAQTMSSNGPVVYVDTRGTVEAPVDTIKEVTQEVTQDAYFDPFGSAPEELENKPEAPRSNGDGWAAWGIKPDGDL